MKIYIISLRSATKRRAFQQQQLVKLKLDYQFFNAISVDDINDALYQKHYYDWQRPIKKTEMACYFSHQALWQKIIDNNQPALILEDDILLSKHTPQILAKLEKYQDIDMVNLEIFNRKKYVGKISKIIDSQHQLLRLYQDRAGSAAYVIFPSGAKKLQDYQQQNGIAPADAFIHSCYSLQAHQVEPAMAIQTMFIQYYNIGQAMTDISHSIINQESKSEQSFTLKRIYGQIKLGLRQLCIIHKSHKRYIKINKGDFSQ